jgi:hypothetical protein
LYESAKAAGTAGDFEEAEGRHSASSVLYAAAGEHALGARALMRALWYQIQRHATHEASEVIKRAIDLSPLEAAGGLLQAIEFCLFEGTETLFQTCCSSLESILGHLLIELPVEWHDDTTWVHAYVNLAQSVCAKLVQAAEQEGRDAWARSDSARILYFRSITASPAERVPLLLRSAAQFEKHQIVYRAHLCRGEAHLWEACVVQKTRSVLDELASAEKYFADVPTVALGVLSYCKTLIKAGTLVAELRIKNAGISELQQFAPIAEEDWAPEERFYCYLLRSMITGDAAPVRASGKCSASELFALRRNSYFLARLAPLRAFLQKIKFPEGMRALPGAQRPPNDDAQAREGRPRTSMLSCVERCRKAADVIGEFDRLREYYHGVGQRNGSDLLQVIDGCGSVPNVQNAVQEKQNQGLQVNHESYRHLTYGAGIWLTISAGEANKVVGRHAIARIAIDRGPGNIQVALYDVLDRTKELLELSQGNDSQKVLLALFGGAMPEVVNADRIVNRLNEISGIVRNWFPPRRPAR